MLFIRKSISKKKVKLTIEVCEDAPVRGYGIPSVVSVNPPDAIGVYGGTHPIFKQRKIVHEKEGVISLRWDPEQWLSVIIRVESPRDELGWEPKSDDHESGGPELFEPVEMNAGSRHSNQNRLVDPLGLEKITHCNSHEAVTAFMRDKEEQVEYVC